MNKTVVVNVTADDIKNGKVGTASQCPIALACQRTRLGVTFVSSRGFDAYPDGSRVAGPMPEAGRRFIRLFDAGEVVQPIKLRFIIEEAPRA